MKKLLVGCALSALAATALHAQETTSTIRGSVTANGAPVAGAVVKVTHIPSGTVSNAVTNTDGSFTASGLRVGGPYTVVVSAAGYSDQTVTDIQTIVAQAYELPIEMTAAGQEVVVTASRVKGAGLVSYGPATVLNTNQISKVASVNRDIRDLMQRDPFATLDNSQSTGRQVTFAGVNPRFNRFTVDGVPITDSFGLNPDALPSRRGPVPLDSIGQFETKVAPYDIREGFFQGGVINAVLRSGTNNFQGTGFYSFSSDKLQGDRTKPYGTNTTGNINVPSYTSKDFGAELSGPIVKDKIFFMIAGERVRASLPVPYGTVDDNAGAPVAGLTSTVFNQITGIANSKYNVDAGGILKNNGDKDDRLVGKLDFNISSSQRFSVTGIYTKDSILTPGTTSGTSLSSLSDDYVKPNRVIAGVAQLNSEWSSQFSTEARVVYKDYKSGQTPILADTAMATVCAAPTSDRTTGGSATSCAPNTPSVIVGPQTSAQANALRIKTFDASLLARGNFGDHVVRAFAEYQNSKNYDLFVNGAKGSYYFDSVADFQAGNASTFSYSNATTLNPNDAAALFTYQTYTFGAQDDWKISRAFSISYGVRYDMYGGSSTPPANAAFQAREGFANTSFINGKVLFQPRFGFDWKPVSRLIVHGGGGLFGGGTPDVYVGNSFSASGVQPASVSAAVNSAGVYTINGAPASAAAGGALLNNVSLTSIPGSANALLKGSTTASVSAIDPNFKIPSQWRATLSATYDLNLGPLGDHWFFGGDLLVSKVKNALLVQDYRNRPITGANATTPDGRQRYYDVQCGAAAGTACADTNGDYVLTDTHRGKGFVAVAHFDKAWSNGLDINGSFTYQNVKDQQAFTSSVASSNYNNGAYFDPNGGAYGHSNDEVKYSIKYNVSYEHEFFGDNKTRIDIFGQTRVGANYSYTFQDISCCGSSRSQVFGTVGTNTHYLFYVPTVGDSKVIYADTATQNAIENLINSTDLKKYRGQVAPRNAFHDPWFTKVDLHFEQQIPTFVGHSKITLFGDVENVLNLIDHNWGQQLRTFFPYYKSAVQVSCVANGANGCAQYKYSAASSTSTLADQLITVNGSSLYAVRVGARISF